MESVLITLPGFLCVFQHETFTEYWTSRRTLVLEQAPLYWYDGMVRRCVWEAKAKLNVNLLYRYCRWRICSIDGA